MNLSMYTVKKWIAYCICGSIPTVLFIFALLSFLDLVMAMIIAIVGIIISGIIANKLLTHPLSIMIEGKGLMTWTIDSTGVIECFICGVNSPFIKGIFKGKEINSIFDRDMVLDFYVPKKGNLVQAKVVDIDGTIVDTCTVLKMPKPEDKPEYLFSFGSFPTFIFNKTLGVFMSKKILSSQEKDTMINHVVLYLLRKTEELSASIRDFARYIVEQTRPHKWLNLKSKWLWIVIIIVIVIIILMMLTPLMGETVEQASSGGGLFPMP